MTACDAPAGAVEIDGDCDDADAAVNPDADETCLTLHDDDCDGSVEDAVDASTWYEDQDGDGWGGEAFQACAMPVGAIDVHGDCDDTNDAVNPSAVETCKTGWDDDCDGSTEGGVDPLPWYVDADGDGVGSVEVLACDQPSGTVPVSGDCDDTDAVLTDVVRANWTTLDGQVTDVTSALTGSPGAPAVWVAPASGTLRLCEGTWYTQMKVSGHAVTIVGVEEEGVILSGATLWHTLISASNQSELTLRRLTLERSEDGPAVVVDSDARLTDVDFLQNDGGDGTGGLEVQGGEVLVEDAAFGWNEGDEGAALSVHGGEVTVRASLFEENTASVRGGAIAAHSTLTLDETTVRLNTAINGGGLVVYDATVTILDSKIRENEASNRGAGAWATDGARVDCVSTGGSYGFWGNVASSGGAVYLESSTLAGSSNVRLSSDNCDWTNGDDNGPNDVGVSHNTTSWDFEDNVQFVCEAGGC